MSVDNINIHSGAAVAAALILALVLFIVAVAAYVVTSFFLMKVFDKAGVQGRWRAWVPVYNYMVFAKLGDLSPWLILISIGASIVLSWTGLGGIIGFLSYLVLALAAWRVGLKLQKEAVWVILYIVLAPVWLGILAFDSSRWNLVIPAAPWAGNGFLSDRTVWAGVPSQVPAGGFPPNPVTAPAYQPPPPGYQPPPAGYTPPPAGYQPPPAPPAGYTPPPAAPEPPSAPRPDGD